MEKAKPRRILVAIDFSGPSMDALDMAHSYALLAGSAVTLMHVLFLTDSIFGAGTFAMPDTAAQITHAAKSELEKLVANVMADGIGCEGIVTNGIPDEEIRKFALDPKNEIDLIVIGTHGRSGLARVAFGSVAQRIIQKSPCPTLVVPAKPA